VALFLDLAYLAQIGPRHQHARRSVAGEFAVQLVELALMQQAGADRPQARQAALP
jgi:hypothetical protein